MHALRRIVSVSVVGTLALVGCAKPAEKAAEAPAPAAAPVAAPTPPAGRDVCAMLTADELKAFGISDAGKPSKSGGADVCTWMTAGGAAIVQVYPYASAYEGARKAFEGLYKTTAEELSGLGDKAFAIEGKTGPMQTTTITAQKGTTPISVQIMGGADRAKLKTQTTDLTRTVLGKL
jgi:hypothetical protein